MWNILKYELELGRGEGAEALVAQAALQLTAIHDLDFERVWLGFNATDRRIIQNLCCGRKLSENRNFPTSTVYSAVHRLVKAGYVIKLNEYEIEDPFLSFGS